MGGYYGIPEFNAIRSIAATCDQLGFDSIWLPDHFFSYPVPSTLPFFECWTTLAALSSVVKNVKLGTLCTCSSYRHPSVLAKMAATLDVLTNGRLEFCIGAGWYKAEYKAYGLDYPNSPKRISQLKESVQIIKKMWTEENPTFEGNYYHIYNAICSPQPLQKPHPPIWIGGKGGKFLLRVVAELAQRSNFVVCSPQEYENKLRLLNRYCESFNRDPSEIKYSLGSGLLIDKSKQRLKQKIKKCLSADILRKGRPISLKEYIAPRIIGTPEECLEKIYKYTDMKVDYFIFWFLGRIDVEMLDLFAQSIMPIFKRG